MRKTQLPELYPGWKTVQKLGSGSFGTVYEIERELFGRVEKSALKHITIPQNDGEVEELYSNGYDDATITKHFETHLAKIVQEYSLMAEMKGYTNVVYCDDIRYTPREEGIGWEILIKMELLTPLLKTLDGEFSEAQVIRLGKDLCRALILCQDRNIVHRDIKPQNIFVSKTGDYKLGDFGIAKTVEQTTGGTKIGTYSYMAPEVFHNKPYGAAADLYSLGLVMYWLMNGRRLPFLPLPPQVPTYEENENARNRRFMGESLPAPRNGSEELQWIVLKACAFDPNARFAGAGEMLEALDGLLPSCTTNPPEKKTVPLDIIIEKTAQMDEEDATVGLFFRDKGSEQRSILTTRHGEVAQSNLEQTKSESHTEQKTLCAVEAKCEAEEKADPEEPSNVSAKPVVGTMEEGRCQKLRNRNIRSKRLLKILVATIFILAITAAGSWYCSTRMLSPTLTKQGDDVYYYIDGSKHTGWAIINGKRYFFDGSGIMQSGWTTINGQKYYFAGNGIMQTGWQKIDGCRYYFDDMGFMRVGWLTLDDDKYFIHNSGEMHTGWLKIGKYWYYFGDDGAMRRGKQFIEGKWYTFSEEGKLIESR